MNSSLESTDVFTMTSRKIYAVACIVFVISLAFALYTNNAWEDWWITYRASKNLATGNGLVFTVGERLHTFTSPLGALIPALLTLVAANGSDELVLWLYRLICCGLLAMTSVMLMRTAHAKGMSVVPTALLVGLCAVDAKLIDFSINGQETAFMMFFLAAVLYTLSAPSARFSVRLGLACAGLMWTRPDSFIYICGLMLGALFFDPAALRSGSGRGSARNVVLAVLVALLAYAPWLIWTWYYYGSPIPHTVIAKGLFVQKPGLELIIKLVKFPFRSLFDVTSVNDTFMPSYFFLGGWPNELVYAARFVGVVCCYYWCLPSARPQGRAVSFALFLAHCYLTIMVVDVWPWYLPSVSLLSIFVIAQIAQQVTERVKLLQSLSCSECHTTAKTLRCLVSGGGGLLLLASVALTLTVGYQVKLQQDIIENGNRKKIGLWLKEQAASPQETVFLECLGYIGYYSQLKMLDFPGLSSNEVVQARRELKTNDFAPLISRLQPDWLVLRPNEINAIQEKMPSLLSTMYRQVKLFDVSEQINAVRFLPGRGFLQYDQMFIVFKRIPGGSTR